MQKQEAQARVTTSVHEEEDVHKMQTGGYERDSVGEMHCHRKFMNTVTRVTERMIAIHFPKGLS